MQAPAEQSGGGLFAPDGRHAAPEIPRALQTYLTCSASGRGGKAPSFTAPHNDRLQHRRALHECRSDAPPRTRHTGPGTGSRGGGEQTRGRTKERGKGGWEERGGNKMY